jgi:histidinol phosphatase-like PHP family hydrolase
MPDLPELRKELGLDYVIGSVHEGKREGATEEEYISRQSELMMNVLRESSPIDVLGHPWGGRSLEQVPEDMFRRLLAGAAALNVGIELSPRFGAGAADLKLLVKRALEEGAKLAPVSDAHGYQQLGETASLQPVLDAAGVRDEQLWFPSGE